METYPALEGAELKALVAPAKISATASMGLKLKIFSDYENVSPHISISVEREAKGVSDKELVAEAGALYHLCREYVQKEAEEDIKAAKESKEGKYVGKKKG